MISVSVHRTSATVRLATAVSAFGSLKVEPALTIVHRNSNDYVTVEDTSARLIHTVEVAITEHQGGVGEAQ